MPPHHRAFTDTLETRQRALRGSNDTGNSSNLGGGASLSSSVATSSVRTIGGAIGGHQEVGESRFESLENEGDTVGRGETSGTSFADGSRAGGETRGSRFFESIPSETIRSERNDGRHPGHRLVSSDRHPLDPMLDTGQSLHPSKLRTGPLSNSFATQHSVQLPPIPPPSSSSTSFAPTTTSARPSIQRQSSLPQVTSRPPRANSYSPTPRTRASPTASTSASRLDPRHHWLSEDEATEGSAPPLRRRAPTRRRGEGGSGGGPPTPPGESDRPTTFGEGKPRGNPLALFDSTTHPSHAIHHRPSKIASGAYGPSPSTTTYNLPLSDLLAIFGSILTCFGCDHLLRDPTTLACGHTICRSCAYPHVIHRAPDLLPLLPPTPSPTLSPGSSSATTPPLGILPTESQFARNPPTPLPASSTVPPPRLNRASSSTSFVTQLLHRDVSPSTSRSTTRGGSGRPSCPHPGCGVTKERIGTFGEPQVDYMLQKVVVLVRIAMVEVDLEMSDEEVDESGEDGGDEGDDEGGDGDRRGMGGSTRSDSMSSGGGGEDSIEDDGKRIHRVRTWTSSKRRRTPSASVDSTANRDKTTTAPAPLDEDDPNTTTSFLADIISELECQICVQLVHDPVTSACGHSFCKRCLARAYDHSDKCPLCRTDFPSFAHFHTQPINSTTHALVRAIFPQQYSERLASLRDEEQPRLKPIFVCTLAWPNLPTYIHIFEPRYRLMIRRAMETDRQFGMVLPRRDADASPGASHEYGTMLYIQSCNMLEDGRSIIETVGTYRFKVLERGTLDGYMVGRIEKVEDITEEEEIELERVALEGYRRSLAREDRSGATREVKVELSTDELMRICLDFVQTLRSGSAPWVVQRLNNTSTSFVV